MKKFNVTSYYTAIPGAGIPSFDTVEEAKAFIEEQFNQPYTAKPEGYLISETVEALHIQKELVAADLSEPATEANTSEEV